jgi:hypothetical protein
MIGGDRCQWGVGQCEVKWSGVRVSAVWVSGSDVGEGWML